MLSRKFLFITFLIFSVELAAKENAKAEKPAEKSEQAEKKGVPAPPQEYSGAQSDEWSKAQKDVQTAQIRYENDKRMLEELRQAAESQENLSKDSLAKINEATAAVKASQQNYIRLMSLYNLRFPEKGLDVGRKYKRLGAERSGIEEETVEEKPQGVEAKLRRLNKNIEHQYLNSSDSNTEDKNKKKKSQPMAEPTKQSSDEPVKDNVTEKIILGK